jgi:hypothetical protein
MIFSLAACFYITAVCWSWGIILFLLLKKCSGDKVLFQADFTLTCFSGLGLVTILTGILSLFIPLGGVLNQLWLITPAILLVFLKRDFLLLLKAQLRTSFRSLHPVLLVSLLVSILLALIISAGEMIHPDTLHYHAQCIQWAEQYRAVPGLANLGYHFGLQSSWFTACAIFSLKFTGSNCPTFLNTAVVLWFIIFIHERIQQCLNDAVTKQQNEVIAGMWLLLFVFSYWTFTQVRVTLSSLSPDFIATLYIWLVFFLYSRYKKESDPTSYLLLIIIFGFFSVTIKLSAVPAALFAAFIFFLYNRNKTANVFAFLLLAFLIISPFIARNIITSGHPLFPSSSLSLLPVDWKLPEEYLTRQSVFIKAYARVGDNTTIYGNEAINNMRLTEWIPLWWQKRSLSNKLIISGLAFLFVLHLLFLKRIKWKENKELLYSFLFAVLGIMLWFKEAPDPRFGFGYIIPAAAILLYLLLSNPASSFSIQRKQLFALLILFSVILTSYAGYRLVYFFKAENVIRPTGIAPVIYQTVNCNGIEFHHPLGEQCGSTPLPCVYSKCNEFRLRGSKITDGFKPAKEIK